MTTAERYQQLIASDRVSGKTREALRSRGAPDDPAYVPAALDLRGLATLRSVLTQVVPQSWSQPIDLAARIDRELAEGGGDGWRHAALPTDAEAYRAALLTLDAEAVRAFGQGFADIDGRHQLDLLTRVEAGELGASQGDRGLNAPQMRSWFEDVRADAVRAYLGHPRTMARIGYSGIAYGGDGEPKSGFARIGPGEREAWEPLPGVDLAE